jgi:hypothetical protein
MKALKTFLFAKSLLVAAMSLSGLSVPVVAHASEQGDGVVCPQDTQASFSNGVLKCSKPKTLASICSPLLFSRLGIKLLNQVVMQPNGSDTCLAVGTGQSVPSEMAPPLPGIDPPASAYHRVINATGPDTFAATQFVFPDNTQHTSGHDPANGAACPSGFTGVSTHSGRGLRCQSAVAATAGCDAPYAIERHTGRDLCVIIQDLGITTARLVGDYTIPTGQGYSGILGNPADHGWTLVQDRSGNIDSWTQTQFKYADAR